MKSLHKLKKVPVSKVGFDIFEWDDLVLLADSKMLCPYVLWGEVTGLTCSKSCADKFNTEGAFMTPSLCVYTNRIICENSLNFTSCPFYDII